MQSAHSVMLQPTVVSPARMEVLRGITLGGLQKQNEDIYGKQNRKNYSEPWRIIFRIMAYLGMVHKTVRREKTLTLSHHLCMGFSWSLALANNLQIDLETEVWKKFPGVCPYCGLLPCSPSCNTKERPADRIHGIAIQESQQKTFRELQTMLREIYPNNVAKSSAGHMLEELCEVAQAIDHWKGRHEDQLFQRIVTESVDVLTHLCAVASCNDLDLAEDMGKIFGNGCPRCRHLECDCQFTTDVAPSVR